ncbi:Na+/H+ antiporter subunit E [Planctobacterium marinum]|uniref:Sodium:proton antiporter n=1 Tax=Planctobacterium marinum TaxID=1631968 RepID=A0AA48HNV0_9ALTE|nr:sodium:proton antiporter [Planctobacterium marinum]
MRHTLSFTVTLMVFWLLLSGHITSLMLSLEVISVVSVILLVHRLGMFDQETHPTNLILKLPKFLSWLIADLIMSNLQVVKLIWQPKPQLSPALLTVNMHQPGDMERVIYANSITVTPGTLTVDLQNDTITVHTLTEDMSTTIRSGERDHKVKGFLS